ncbi:hypothetical protein N0V88_002504 [Collariella sp. IMI 366227]|nr:hypothetical protein N0V88_002504 [Collariella sp. IMI 366227]
MASEADGTLVEEDTKVYIINRPPGAKRILARGPEPSPNEVIKVPLPAEIYEQAHGIERRIYNRLGKRPNLVSVVKMDEYGIYLTRAEHGCIRMYYMTGGTATLRERIKWCRDAAADDAV